MKKEMRILLLTVLSCAINFSLFSFTIWDVNPANWATGARYFFSCLQAVLVVSIALAVIMSEPNP